VSIRALLVDDVAEYRFLVRLVLEEDPSIHIVGEAADGAAGVRLAEALRPDAVLLDLAMPAQDGLEALPRLRELLPGACLLVLSAFQASRMEATALAAGADAYIEKGTPLADVRERLLACRTAA
jgi:DNA-binding NarL/FixJ family response regulator